MKTLNTVSPAMSTAAQHVRRQGFLLTLLVLLSFAWALAAMAANLIANPGFENSPPSGMGNNIGHGVAPWVVGSGASPNVVRVDGTAGFDYGTSGPESDGTAPGAGKMQHYLDITDGSNRLYQSFKVPMCNAAPGGSPVKVIFAGKFSTRDNLPGNGKVEILSGTGVGGTVLSSQAATLPAGASKTTPWTTVNGVASVARGATFTYLVTMDNNVNFDDANVVIEADPCEVTETDNGQNEEVGCVSGKYEVACGKTPGTYVITLNANTSGASKPKFVEISVLTPGVSILNPKPKYLVGAGGKVQVTLVGAKPGDVIEFDISGSRPDPKSGNGMSICCVGKVKITIPRDLNCTPPSTVSIDKKCSPVTYGKYPVNAYTTGIGWRSRCTITVTTTGPQSGTLSVSDGMSGGTVVSMGSTSSPTWNCAGTGCTINGANLNQNASASTFNVDVVFPNQGAVREGKNCAKASVDQTAKAEDCESFRADDGKLTVIKEAYVKGTRYTSQSFPTKVTCGGNVVTTSIQDGAAAYVQTGIPLGTTCSVVEGNNIATPAGFCRNGSVASWNVGYSPASSVVINGNTTVVVKNELVCNPPPPNGDIKITKVCEPAKQLDSPVRQFGSECKITVSTAGPVSGPLTVSDTLAGAGTLGPMTSTSAPAWTCAAGQCTINGAALNQTNSVSVFAVNVAFPPGNGAEDAAARNCARIAPANRESCAEIRVPEDRFALDVKKSCDKVTELQSGGPWAATCAITVTATGGPRPPFISITESLQDSNTARTPPAMLMSQQTADAWTCQPLGSGVPANTPVACTIPGAAFPASGTSVINFTMMVPKGTKPGEAQNCVTAESAQAPGVPAVPATTAGPSCANLPGEETEDPQPGTLSVVKTCAPAVQVAGSNQATAQCQITVTGSGALPGQITVAETLNGLGNPVNQITSLTSNENWSFPPTPVADQTTAPMTLASADLLAAGGTSVINVTIRLFDLGTAMESQNCVSATTSEAGGNAGSGPSVPDTCVQLTAAPPNVTPPPPPKPVCDARTTKLVGNSCRCTIRGMVPTSKTSCGCPEGQKLNNGRCTTPPPPPPKCDSDETLVNGRCVKKPVVCKQGFRLVPGTKTCRPIIVTPKCGPREKLNTKTNTCVVVRPVCKRDQRYDNRTNSCVTVRVDCPKGTVFNRKSNRCDRVEQRCPAGTIKTKRGCIEVPRCRPPLIPVPGTNRCLNPFDIIKPRDEKKECFDGGIRVECR